MASLQSLDLGKLHINDFPGNLASALVHLTHLSLANNRFTQLPRSLTQITSLRSINVSINQNLELKPEDLEIVRAMPHLKEFCYMGDLAGKFSCESLTTMLHLKEQFPNLKIT